MSRTNISFDMRQFCKVFWHPLKKTAHFVCKRCANNFSQKSKLQKHKLNCSLDFEKRYRQALEGEKYLSQKDVEAALNALRIEVPQPIEQRIATQRQRARPSRFLSVSSSSSSSSLPPSRKSKRIEVKEQEGHHSKKTLAVKAFIQSEKLSSELRSYYFSTSKMESTKDSDYGSGESIFGDTDSDGSFSSDFSYFSAHTGISDLSPDSTDNTEEGAVVEPNISNLPFALEYIVIEGEEEIKDGETFLLVDCEGLNEEEDPSEVNYGLNNLSLSEPDLDETLRLDLELGAVETVENESFITDTKVKIENEPLSETGSQSRKRKLQDSPLLKSVLEKTLFVSVKRCDNLMKNKKPKLEQKNEQSNVPNDESWDVIPSESSSDSDSGTNPIKLKIKRRLIKSESDDGQQNTKTPKKNTSSAQFFKGVCSCCGSKTNFENSRTYYKKDNPEDKKNRLFCCCTCFNTFGKDEWEDHNRECFSLEEVEAGLCDDKDNPIVYGMEMKRDFVCSACFKSMSNC